MRVVVDARQEAIDAIAEPLALGARHGLAAARLHAQVAQLVANLVHFLLIADAAVPLVRGLRVLDPAFERRHVDGDLREGHIRGKNDGA